MAWPEEIYQAVDSTWYLKWQSETEISFLSRKTEDEFNWYFWFLVRSVIYGYILVNVFNFLKKRVPAVLGRGPYREDPNRRKLARVVLLFSSSNPTLYLYTGQLILLSYLAVILQQI